MHGHPEPMPLDATSYLAALAGELQSGRPPRKASEAVGYCPVATAVFEQAAVQFGDHWAARIWFEFARPALIDGLTPWEVCDHGDPQGVLEALRDYGAAHARARVPSDDEAVMTWIHSLCEVPSNTETSG